MWDRVDEPTRRFWIERGERYCRFDWPPLEPLYRDYHETGSRQRFEPTYHRRRQAVTTFVLAEALEHRGRFIEPLLDAVNRLCDEPTWVLPAHEQQEVDLFSAETGNLIAWTCYILEGNRAFSASARVPRALGEVRARVLEPYLTRDDYWWMALNGQKPSNWTTWCTSNCLGTALLIETDTRRRAAAIEKACRSLDRFIEAYAEDGGCDEGPMYWNFAAGCLYDALEMLHEASGGALDLFGEPAIHNLAGYIAKVHIHDLYFVNFADSPPQVPVDAALLHRFGTRIGDPRLQALGGHIYRLLDRYDPEDTLRLKMYRTLATIAASTPLRALPGPDLARHEEYLPKLQVAVAREDERPGRGLVLAAKGGHNGEHHNHNDVGNVIVYLDGHPAIVDAGMKQYSKDTFSDRRYEIWAMQSAYHNVPLINGCMQIHGVHAAGHEPRFKPGEDATRFEVGIAAAYPPAAALTRWRRECSLERSRGAVRIRDEFQFGREDNRYEQRFMTACRPRLVDGHIELEVAPGCFLELRTAPTPTRATLYQLDVKDRHIQGAWRNGLYHIRLCFEGVGAQGQCETLLTVRRGAPQAAAAPDSPFEIEELS
jgi:hypothetical protein